MIVAERREGGIRPEVDARSRIPKFWLRLDRMLPLAVKLIPPVMFVTLVGTGGLGLYEAQQTNNELDKSYIASATATANVSAEFYSTMTDPSAVNRYLAEIVDAQNDVLGVWIVHVGTQGAPVVASSNAKDLGRTGILEPPEIAAVASGRHTHETVTLHGTEVLETVVPVPGNEYGVMVYTSLAGEQAAFRSTLLTTLLIAVVITALEVVSLMVLIEAGVMRRLRRVAGVIDSFGHTPQQSRLSEGLEPRGRDPLFNLARSVDHKLTELGERERASGVISQLGILALQGAKSADLTRKALEVTRQAGDLERCFLVDAGGTVSIVESTGTSDGETTEAKLPIWLGALVRAAAQARRPVLADGLGQDSRYWEAGSISSSGVAAFVPLAGTPNPIGVMVGVARQGAHISAVTVSMMEAVATALGESVQRSEADKARHESEAKSKALSTVSHEMRNPLNAMLGFSNLLLTGAAGPLNEKQTGYVRRVDEASQHLLRLVNDYLDLAKVMSGSLPVVAEPVAVGPEVESMLELLRPTAESKGVSIRAEVVPNAVARADRLRLRQVLMNLVSNAIKFTPARGHVRVEVAGGSNGIRISVIDTGIGIPADRQHLVFTEFAQLRPDSRSEGTGLGLALTKRFVEAMGGFIRFTSAEGAGTIFDVWLPGEQSPVKAATPEGAPAAPVAATAAAAEGAA